MLGEVSWPTLGHCTKLPLDGRRNATNILIYNILSRKQGSNPAKLKQQRPSSVIQLKTFRWDEALIYHQKLKNVHSEPQAPYLSNLVFYTVRYNSSVHLMTTYMRSKVEHYSFCLLISTNRRLIGLYTNCPDGLGSEKFLIYLGNRKPSPQPVANFFSTYT